jgi:hypothetical protein
MAERDSSPWTMTCHPAEVAACTTSTRFSMSRGAWADPDLVDLVAPPVTVTAFTTRATEAATPRRPGRHRSPAPRPRRHRSAHVAGPGPGSREFLVHRFYTLLL